MTIVISKDRIVRPNVHGRQVIAPALQHIVDCAYVFTPVVAVHEHWQKMCITIEQYQHYITRHCLDGQGIINTVVFDKGLLNIHA
jgi:hypothetical protein